MCYQNNSIAKIQREKFWVMKACGEVWKVSRHGILTAFVSRKNRFQFMPNGLDVFWVCFSIYPFDQNYPCPSRICMRGIGGHVPTLQKGVIYNTDLSFPFSTLLNSRKRNFFLAPAKEASHT